MRIDMTAEAMALLRGLRTDGGPLWQAIELLRSNPRPADALSVPEEPGLLEKHVRVGDRGYWLIWEVKKDRGATVIRVAIIEEN